MPALSDIFAPQRFYPGMSPDFMPDYGGVSGETPTQYDALGEISYGMTNVGGLQDAAGYSGGPSIRENVDQGNYGSAALQAAGTLPVVGGLAATLGKAALGGAALYKAAKGVSKAEMDPSLLRVLVGPGGKYFNPAAADQAREMIAKNPSATPHMTEKAHGTMLFGDNVPFQEFSDRGMTFNIDPMAMPVGKTMSLSKVLTWPSLERNYPDLANRLSIRKMTDPNEGLLGRFGNDLIEFNDTVLQKYSQEGLKDLYAKGLLSTIAHEGQHAISEAENASAGGNWRAAELLRNKMAENNLSPKNLASIFAMPGVPEETTIRSLQNVLDAPTPHKAYTWLEDEARARTTGQRRALGQDELGRGMSYSQMMDLEALPAQRITLPQDWMTKTLKL